MMTGSKQYTYYRIQYAVKYPSKILTGSHMAHQIERNLLTHFSLLSLIHIRPHLHTHHYQQLYTWHLTTHRAYVPIYTGTPVYEDHFLKTLTYLHSQKSQCTKNKIFFQFTNTEEAKLHNASILKGYNYDIAGAIAAQPNTQISFGSEFLPVTELKPLLSDHPHWHALKLILLDGATSPLQPVSQEHRSMDIHYHHDRGNHKSAISIRICWTKQLQKILQNASLCLYLLTYYTSYQMHL